MDLNVIFTFIRDNGTALNEQIENDALNNHDRASLNNVLHALEEIREQDIQNMSERGVNPSDYPDEQIGVDGYSIDELIEHVEELIAAAPMAAEGGKRKSRKSKKSRKTRKHKRSRKLRKTKRRRHTRRYR
jgi:ribosomal protein L12E/L44/L45/RPP1/RPP2